MPLMPPDDRIIACRVAHGHEPSAVLLVHRVETLTGEFADGAWSTEVTYEVPAIERIPGGSSHDAIADVIGDLVDLAQDERAHRVSVAIDVTVPGVPFLRLMRDRKIRSAAVMVGDAALARAEGRLWQIPMRELLSIALQVIAAGRLQVAPELTAAQAIAEQLRDFRTKAPPRDSLSDWRPAQHDDLARALMIATWWGERMLRSIVRQPPAPRPTLDPARPPTFDQALAQNRRDRRRTARGSRNGAFSTL